MKKTHLIDLARAYLATLCTQIPQRCVGSEGNRAATAFFCERMQTLGFRVEEQEFECFDWTDRGSVLRTADTVFDVHTGPYTRDIRLEAPLCSAASVDELKTLEADGKILLLYGGITSEQLMPKNFPFYNPDHHQKIIHLLERSGAKAIVSATTRDPQTAGAVYPFPLIEDGDFEIPTVYMTGEEGDRLLKHSGKTFSLNINTQRSPAAGCNIAGVKNGGGAKRIVVCAHIDSKQGTPGAIDNATGIIVLLLLAELMPNVFGNCTIEIVALNGEDYYSAPGQRLYLEKNKDTMTNIELAINLDGAGYYKGDSAFSLYQCHKETEEAIRKTMEKFPGIKEGPSWYQSDHSMFIQHGVPAMAITSGNFMEKLAAEIIHTPQDNPGIVDVKKLVEIACALDEILRNAPVTSR
jgi:aminopeptidase YwaD